MDEVATADNLQKRKPTLKYVVDILFPASRDSVILDLGCGHGALIQYARQRGYAEITGVDISAQQVELAARLGIKGISQCDLFQALSAIEPGSVDAVIAFDVIEHFDRRELFDFADKVRIALKKGGRWIIHAPNGASPFAGSVIYGDITHEIAFTPSSLSQLVAATGFRSINFYECAPRCHSLKSALRAAMWLCIRLILRIAILAETGGWKSSCIISRNFYAIAWN